MFVYFLCSAYLTLNKQLTANSVRHLVDQLDPLGLDKIREKVTKADNETCVQKRQFSVKRPLVTICIFAKGSQSTVFDAN